MKIEGNTYRERVNHQLDEWIKGNPIHNDIDDECCPDFSCCKPELLQPKGIRKIFKVLKVEGNKEIDAWEKDNSLETPKHNKMKSMLFSFLSFAISNIKPNENVYITDGHTNKEILDN